MGATDLAVDIARYGPVVFFSVVALFYTARIITLHRRLGHSPVTFGSHGTEHHRLSLNFRVFRALDLGGGGRSGGLAAVRHRAHSSPRPVHAGRDGGRQSADGAGVPARRPAELPDGPRLAIGCGTTGRGWPTAHPRRLRALPASDAGGRHGGPARPVPGDPQPVHHGVPRSSAWSRWCGSRNWRRRISPAAMASVGRRIRRRRANGHGAAGCHGAVAAHTREVIAPRHATVTRLYRLCHRTPLPTLPRELPGEAALRQPQPDRAAGVGQCR